MKSSACALILFACLCTSCSRDTATPVETSTPAVPAAAAAASDGAPNVVTGMAPVRAGQPSIVLLQPAATGEVPPQSQRPVMDQVSQTFIPGFLLVRTGQAAEFRNSDDVLHNVRVNESATKQGTFNVAIPTGEQFLHTFERDGFYDVGCDIHPGMSATIFSSSSPYAVITDTTGAFEIHDVPVGAYTAVIYVGAEKIERPLQVVPGRTALTINE
jgi:plastocyanin